MWCASGHVILPTIYALLRYSSRFCAVVESVEEEETDDPDDPEDVDAREDDREDAEELFLTLFRLEVAMGEERQSGAEAGFPGVIRCRRFPVGGSGGATELGVCGMEVCEDFVGVSSSWGDIKTSFAS